MKFEVSVPELSRRLARMEQALNLIIGKIEQMALDFVRLETEVAEIGTVVDSAVTLLNSVAQDIRDNIANQAKLGVLADNLDAKAAALGAAIEANTTPTP